MTTEIERTPDIDKKIRDKARMYPDWWIETVLGGKLWPMQIAIAQSTFYYPRTTVRACEAVGKTYVAARIALAFLYNFGPKCLVITTAPTNRQVEDILWREIRATFAESRFPLDGKLTRKDLELDEQWFATGFATDEPARMLGYHEANVLVIVDDAAGLSNDIFAAIENPLSTGNTHELLLSNPTQSVGNYRDTFGSSLYKKYQISAFDSPNLASFGITEEDIITGEWEKKWAGQELPMPQLISPAKVSERYKNWGPGSYLYIVFIKGEFPDAGVNNLVPLSDIEYAMSREIDRKEYEKSLKIAALDVARYGDDESCWAIRQGNRVLDVITWGHQDSTYTQGRTANLIRQERPVRTYIDVIGLGAGVYDNLKKEIGEEFNIQEFSSSNEALVKERFLNRRAEGYWLLKEKLAARELDLPDNENLKAQLADIRYTYTTSGKLQIESKEDSKKRGSVSPDIADAVMMSFSTKRGGGRRQTRY